MSVVRRDLRRFLIVRWALLDVPAHAPINLNHEWRQRRGYDPGRAGEHVVRGYHFVRSAARAVYVPALQGRIDDPAMARACAVIASKYEVEATPALSSELPKLPQLRAPDKNTIRLVDEWPAAHERLLDLIVLEYPDGIQYVARTGAVHGAPWVPAVTDPRDGLLFVSLEEAEQWIDANAPGERVTARYLAAALAESELRTLAAAGWW